ncbi:hypothetical protein ACFFKC_16340, partial [Pseudoduganella danionis]|uniref:hypothetical protein n=1 Tax=Pseudoduganella danionis TaxID=1890295 RepID=UPI0035E80B68
SVCCRLAELAVAVVPLLGALSPGSEGQAVVSLLGVLPPGGAGRGRCAAARWAATWWRCPWPLCRCSARC